MKKGVFRSNLPWLYVLVLVLVSLPSCASKEEKKAEHLKRAKQYIEKNELRKAVIELKNVVQLDPQNDDAHYTLGETYLKLKEGREAFKAFSRAASVNPDNLEAQLKLGQIFLLGRNPAEARKKADLILSKSPKSIDAMTLLSGIYVQEKDLDAAVKTLDEILTIEPNHFKTHLALGRLLLTKNETEKAEKSYLKAQSLDPQAREPYVELAGLYLKKGDAQRAESELKKMLALPNSDHQDRLILARFYESAKKWDQSESTYIEAVQTAPEEDIVPLFNLAGYYARRKSYPQALETLEKAAAIKKDDPNVLVSIAQLHFDFQKLSEAETAVDIVLERDRGHVAANFLKGRIYLVKKDFAAALERFEVVTRERPSDPHAYYLKALCLVEKGERKLAEQALARTVEIEPRHTDARLLLAELYMRDRSLDLARQQLDPVLKQAPEHMKALTLSGNLLMLEKKFSEAETTFKKVVSMRPNDAPAHVRLGLLYSLTERTKLALQSLETALSLNPHQNEALVLMVSIYLREKKHDQALALCSRLKARPEIDQIQAALINYLEGNIYFSQGELEKARQSLEGAIEKNPNLVAVYAVLARVYMRQGKLEDAVAQYERIIEKNPKNLSAHMALGTIYDHKGDGEKAQVYYRKALEVKKDFGPAANNLAWNLAEGGGNIDEALGFAQIAKEQLPKSAGVMDTLGWIYYLKGSYLNAIAELQDSVEIEPENALINYHLGLAYSKNNQPDQAREYLEKALKIAPNFRGAEEARTVLADQAKKTN
jgi:Tfp pilus assembly protein PilF